MESKKKRIPENSCCCYYKSNKVLSVGVTDEHVPDSKMLPKLVNDIIKSNTEITGKLLADGGAYDSNDIFRCASDNGIYPSCIKVRKNAIRHDYG